MENKSIAIKTNNLTKRFGAIKAVDALNIEINQREVFSLLGRNGAGKTTTIKCFVAYCCHHRDQLRSWVTTSGRVP